MDNEDNFLAGLGVILLLIILGMTLIPLLLGIGIALIAGATGLMYYGIVITVAAVIWLIIGLVMWF